ncbi:uncharacterized protein EAE98_007636 [Botrytis deweyae]|uniref:Uncharacterized protein n=1 Tax=Botrytis deweyae TaxID=2478750 RepID=A0ABQ7IGV0_9HELO|nr:uncharacterized protein EAE98_007636 [Botrytis deweyae]KAF7923818.1 hypothetical protein EAE98_007636 [Botrytis deweyae]
MIDSSASILTKSPILYHRVQEPSHLKSTPAVSSPLISFIKPLKQNYAYGFDGYDLQGTNEYDLYTPTPPNLLPTDIRALSKPPSQSLISYNHKKAPDISSFHQNIYTPKPISLLKSTIMDIQNTYTHSCHHIAHGPVLSNPLIYLPLTTHTRSLLSPQKLNLKVPFRCPFCEDPDLHDTVPAGKGVLVIMSSLKKENERSEVVERLSESKLLPSIPSIYSAPYPPYLPTFCSFYSPPPVLSLFPPHFPFSPTSYHLSSPKVPNRWKIIRICGVEDIKSTEWAYEIETETVKDKNAIEHPENMWSERRQNLTPREEEWIPMAWIPRPVGDVDVLAIPDTGPHNTFHFLTGSRLAPHYPPSSSHSNSNPQNQKLHISQSWRGTTGEDSNGYGYRGRILGQSRLPGMMSELGTFLRNNRAEDGNSGSRTDMRERMRERGLRWE